MSKENELLIQVAERFLFHREKAASSDPVENDAAKRMCSIEISEMWMLTQGGGRR